MIWRAGPLLVVQRGETFVLIDASGAIVKQLLPQRWAYDEDMGETTYVVAGGQLRRSSVTTHWGGRVSSEDEVVVDSLVPADDEDSATFVRVALGDAAVVQEERERAATERAQSRVLAIDGASDELGHGRDVAAAQDALWNRVYRYADERAAQLLRMLITLVRAGVDARVIERFARGCRYACFERPAELATEDAIAPGPPALAQQLHALADELDKDSDHQEWVDATANASSLFAAAAQVRQAARLLEGKPPT